MERDTLSKLGALLLLVSSLALTVYYSRPLPPSGKTVVRYLTYETGPAQMLLVNEIKARFEKANPDVEVQVEFNQSARDKIYVEMASHTAPDTFYVVTDDLPRLAVKNAVEPLNQWFAKGDGATLAPYFKQVVQALRYAPPYEQVPTAQQDIWAYPIHFSTDVLFYNQAMFDEAGLAYPNDNWTWQDMVEAARKLTKKDGAGRTVQFGMFQPDPTTTIVSNDGAIFNDAYTECLIANPRAVEAITELRNLRFVYKVAPDPAQIQGTSSMQMFKLGQLAMLPGRTYMAVDFNKIKEFTYNAALMPGMRRPAERLAVGGMAMSRQISPKQKEAAWRWMQFYCSPEGGQEVLGREKNAVTAVKAYALSPDYFMHPPPANSKVFVTSIENAVITTPPIVNAAEYINAIRNPKFDDMLRKPDTNIPAMLKQYQAETNTLLKREPTN
jgi:ABC-type glycerol-3-phosphate transport system substrate-binding protein